MRSVQAAVLKLLLLLYFLVLNDVAFADEEEEDKNMNDNTISKNTTSTTPVYSAAPSPSPSPSTVLDICVNTPDWILMDYNNHYYYCDDEEISCDNMGSLGYADDHCCKCKPDCCGKCKVPCITTATTARPSYEPTPRPTWIAIYNKQDDCERRISNKGAKFGAFGFLLFFVVIILCCKSEQRALRNTRRAMVSQRRRRQRHSEASDSKNNKVSTERHEQFLSKFQFHMVSREKSKSAQEHSESLDGEAPNNNETKDVEGGALHNSKKESKSSSLPQRFSSARDECCICLDGYHPGETICLAVNTECSHVFHQECVLEWLKSHSQCPLCRVDLMK
jgi:hypothetical protein